MYNMKQLMINLKKGWTDYRHYMWIRSNPTMYYQTLSYREKISMLNETLEIANNFISEIKDTVNDEDKWEASCGIDVQNRIEGTFNAVKNTNNPVKLEWKECEGLLLTEQALYGKYKYLVWWGTDTEQYYSEISRDSLIIATNSSYTPNYAKQHCIEFCERHAISMRKIEREK